MKKYNIYLGIFLLIIFFIASISAANYNAVNNIIYECGNITEAGNYIINMSITGDRYLPQSRNANNDENVCIQILNDSVNLNCNSSIISNDTRTFAIYSYNKTNLTIKNCVINFPDDSYGIVLEYTTNSTIFNNIINRTSSGIFLRYQNINNSITNNNCSFTGDCITLSSSSYNNLRFNYASGNIFEVSLFNIASGSNYNTFFKNKASLTSAGRGVTLNNVSHNRFYYENYTSYDGGFIISRISNNNSIYHSHLTSLKSSVKQVIELNGARGNNINFINCSFNDSHIIIRNDSLELKKKWFLKINISNGSSPMNLANVTGYQINSSIEFSVLTNSSGNYNSTIEVIEYSATNRSSLLTIDYYNNYTLTVNVSDYGINTFSRNISSNTNLNLLITDMQGPSVTLVTPNETISVTSSAYDINFTLNATDRLSNIANCSFVITGSYYDNTSEITEGLYNSQIITLGPGSYTAYASCTDSLNNIGQSESISIEIATPETPSSGGGGGGGGGGSMISSSIYLVTEEQISQGVIKDLLNGDKIKFKVSKEDHQVAVNSASTNDISINVSSTLQQKTILIGTIAKFDLNNDNIYELSIKYDNYNSTTKKARLMVIKISEPITAPTPVVQATQEQTPTPQDNNNQAPPITPVKRKVNPLFIWVPLVIIIIIVIIGFVFYFLIYKKKTKK